jgi:hypothetical protein
MLTAEIRLAALNTGLWSSRFLSQFLHILKRATDKWAYGIGKISTNLAHYSFGALMIWRRGSADVIGVDTALSSKSTNTLDEQTA